MKSVVVIFVSVILFLIIFTFLPTADSDSVISGYITTTAFATDKDVILNYINTQKNAELINVSNNYATDFIWPLENDVQYDKHVRPGDRKYDNDFHTGVDLQVGNVPVLAVANGVVEVGTTYSGTWYTRNDSDPYKSYGNYILLTVDNYSLATNASLSFRYAHLAGEAEVDGVRSPNVISGERYVKGTPLAIVGTTGNSTGNHLHWEALTTGGETRYYDPVAIVKYGMHPNDLDYYVKVGGVTRHYDKDGTEIPDIWYVSYRTEDTFNTPLTIEEANALLEPGELYWYDTRE
ncbi:MAG: M23 family metallopeptidase [Endomicrobium sp.]|jgi:murein DD-endopeptidase MepM/ murein hydrolase activator NlpD|nr:M23 family metallopeptidase [Endomicrobium sp.]